MFKITHKKNRPYITSDPQKALEAYQNKNSLSMYHDENVIRTKCIVNGEVSNRLTYQYLERS